MHAIGSGGLNMKIIYYSLRALVYFIRAVYFVIRITAFVCMPLAAYGMYQLARTFQIPSVIAAIGVMYVFIEAMTLMAGDSFHREVTINDDL